MKRKNLFGSGYTCNIISSGFDMYFLVKELYKHYDLKKIFRLEREFSFL